MRLPPSFCECSGGPRELCYYRGIVLRLNPSFCECSGVREGSVTRTIVLRLPHRFKGDWDWGWDFRRRMRRRTCNRFMEAARCQTCGRNDPASAPEALREEGGSRGWQLGGPAHGDIDRTESDDGTQHDDNRTDRTEYFFCVNLRSRFNLRPRHEYNAAQYVQHHHQHQLQSTLIRSAICANPRR